MLFLVLGFTAGILMLVLFFAFNTTRFIGSHEEQVTAIEGAAMAAAHDLSAIVVDDADLGLVSLSDYPPSRKGTRAGDNYYVQVHSINTILATVRLDMIVADVLNDQILKDYALRDYDIAMSARTNLVTALQTAITAGGSGRDADGNIVQPLADAINAYKSNQIRIASGRNSLVPNSMTLSLGCNDNLVTNTHIPEPSNFARMQPDQQENSFYKAYINVPYDKKDFVFAALGDNVTLADFRNFKTSNPDLPYIIPSIVKCEADQQFDDKDQNGAGHETRSACGGVCRAVMSDR